MSENNKIVSQEIMSESKERGIKEELRQMQVKEAVRDFNKYGQGSSRRTCVIRVNSITRAAIGNWLEINALIQEVWAFLQEAQTDSQEEQEINRTCEREAYWNLIVTNLL